MDINNNEKSFHITASEDEIAACAANAARSVSGVAEIYTGFSGSITNLLGMEPSEGQGVKVGTKDGELTIDVSIIAEYGVRIPQLAWEIQKTVIDEIKEFAGVSPAEVNIHVQGVVAPGEDK